MSRTLPWSSDMVFFFFIQSTGGIAPSINSSEYLRRIPILSMYICVHDLSLFEQHQYSEHGTVAANHYCTWIPQLGATVEVANCQGKLTLSIALRRKPTFRSWSLQRITSLKPGRISALLIPTSAPVTGRTMAPHPSTEATCCRWGDKRKKHPHVNRKQGTGGCRTWQRRRKKMLNRNLGEPIWTSEGHRI